MKHFDRQINRDFSNAAILCAGSVYPITGGNDSSRDYWRVLKNGDLFDDGNDSEVRDENDQLLFTNKNGAKKQDTLEQFLGLKSGTGYSSLMQNAGFGDYLGNGKWSGEGSTISASAIKGLVDEGLASTKYMDPRQTFYNQKIEGYKHDYAVQERRDEIMKNAPPELVNNLPMTSELIEQYVGLPVDSACFIASDIWMNMQFQGASGKAATNQEALAALRSVKGKAFSDQAIMSNPDLLAIAIMDVMKGDSYLQYIGQYSTRDTVLAKGYAYYSEIRTKTSDASREHCMAWMNSQLYDPETSTSESSRWWKDYDNTSVRYYGFTPKKRW